MKSHFWWLPLALLAACSPSPKQQHLTVHNSSLIQETHLQQAAGADFEQLVGLMADDPTKQAIKAAQAVEINGFTILYATPDELFIIKDRHVITRIRADGDKTLYRSTLAPLSGAEVHLTDHTLVYHYPSNTFIDYGIDGIDLIETNHLEILDTRPTPIPARLPNTAFIANRQCQTWPNLSRTACCGQTGYAFTWEHGWKPQAQITEKCSNPSSLKTIKP